jgi:hypothetical protein
MTDPKVLPFANIGNGRDKRQRFQLVKFDDITLDAAEPYLVKGLIPRQGLGLVWGPAKCGKSFWTFDLVMHIALGRPYRGHKVQQGLVLYIALEGAHGYRARVEAFRQKFLEQHEGEIPFHLCGDKLTLALDQQLLSKRIEAQLNGKAPSVIVIDTVNRSLAGPEDDKTLSPYVQAADALREAFDCVVLLVHHSGYDKTHARGHTLLPAAVDTEIAIRRDEANNVVATVVSMRDGPADEEIASRLVKIPVGEDREGDVITSCYIEPLDSVPPAVKAAAKTGRGGGPSELAPLIVKAYDALCLDGQAQRSLDLDGYDQFKVKIDVLRAFLMSLGQLDHDDGKLTATARTWFHRAKLALTNEATGKFMEEKGEIWRCKK